MGIEKEGGYTPEEKKETGLEGYKPEEEMEKEFGEKTEGKTGLEGYKPEEEMEKEFETDEERKERLKGEAEELKRELNDIKEEYARKQEEVKTKESEGFLKRPRKKERVRVDRELFSLEIKMREKEAAYQSKVHELEGLEGKEEK